MTGKAETHNHEMAQSGVTFALPFCRNQSIRRMSRVCYQPSQVGKAYDWFQWWNCLGFSEPVPDNPDVTVATLCLLSVRDLAKYGFLLLVLICHNCGDTPHFP